MSHVFVKLQFDISSTSHMAGKLLSEGSYEVCCGCDTYPFEVVVNHHAEEVLAQWLQLVNQRSRSGGLLVDVLPQGRMAQWSLIEDNVKT